MLPARTRPRLPGRAAGSLAVALSLHALVLALAGLAQLHVASRSREPDTFLVSWTTRHAEPETLVEESPVVFEDDGLDAQAAAEPAPVESPVVEPPVVASAEPPPAEVLEPAPLAAAEPAPAESAAPVDDGSLPSSPVAAVGAGGPVVARGLPPPNFGSGGFGVASSAIGPRRSPAGPPRTGTGSGSAPARLRVSSVQEPVVRAQPAPAYPRLAKHNGEEGTVVCRLHLTATGVVEKVEVIESSGFERLDEAARTALLAWVFDPKRVDGVAVPTTFEHRVTFRLTKS